LDRERSKFYSILIGQLYKSASQDAMEEARGLFQKGFGRSGV
jgi:hypothetical protein